MTSQPFPHLSALINTGARTMRELEAPARVVLGLGTDDPTIRIIDGLRVIEWPNGIRPQRVLIAVDLFEQFIRNENYLAHTARRHSPEQETHVENL